MIKDEKISRKIKIIITLLIFFAGAGAYLYESGVNKKESKTAQLLQNFKQGKALKCGDIIVTDTKFNYEFGTASFVAKRDIKELAGIIIPIKNCANE